MIKYIRAIIQSNSPSTFLLICTLTCNVMFQIFNNKILFADDIFYNITNGDNAYQFTVFHNGQMTDEFISHLPACIHQVCCLDLRI